jgi:hypothetical protein
VNVKQPPSLQQQIESVNTITSFRSTAQTPPLQPSKYCLNIYPTGYCPDFRGTIQRLGFMTGSPESELLPDYRQNRIRTKAN